MSYAAYID